MNEKKYDGPRIMGPIAGPYLSEAELVKLGWMKSPATSFTMTDVTFAEIWDREKKRLRRGFRGRQKDLSPYFVQAECEEAARAGAKELQKLARAEKREAYDKARGNRPSGRRLNDRPQGGMVVAVDSEGMFVGEPFVLKAGRWKAAVSEDEALRRIANGESVYHRQRTYLWMAGGVEGFEDDILYDPQGLRSERIFEFLVSRPRKFASPDPRARQPVFVGFGLSYDIAQILADLPNDTGNMKLWEIRKGKPWEKRDDPTWRANYEGWHLWRSWAVAVLPGKKIKICKLRDPNRPFKYRLRKNGETERTVDWVERIVIYDVFGFYQRSLVEAIETMPGIISDEQMAIIKVGKMKRGELQQKDLNQAVFDESKLYTGTELIALTRMVEKTRKAIYDADPDRPIRLRHLYGAGAAAQGLLETRLSAEAREILGRIEFVDDGGLASGIPALVEADLADAVDETMESVLEEIAGKSAPEGSPDHEPHEDTLQDKSPLIAATYAFVGGRIELVKQGKTTKRLYSNDISSAYPAEIAELPSMKGGRWVYCKNPTRKQIVESNRLSMFHVRTLFAVGEPFYPLPYRNGDGSIMFPSHAQGCYMRDDVLAAFEWRDVLGHHGLYRDGGLIDVKEALFFEPGEPDDRPFAWVRELFDYRAALMKIDPNDVRAIVIKLMLNAIYGKFAQGVGNPGSPPRFASPWMAAAITAGTRRKLLKAALTAPKAIVSFMTDGIVSEKPLNIRTSPEGVKALGEWEATKIHESGGVFVQSGFYHVTEPKTRGFRAAKAGDPALPRDERVRKIMLEDIPACWKDGKSSYEFDYSQYIGLGSAVQSVDATAVIGCWKTSRRSQQLDTMSRKRVVPASPKLRRSRAERLIALGVSDASDDLVDGKWSAPHKPDWLNKDAENEFDQDEETKNTTAGRT